MKWQRFSQEETLAWIWTWDSFFSCGGSICLKNQWNLGAGGLFWVPRASLYGQLKMWFFFSNSVVPPDPSLTICLTCLTVWNVIGKIMGRCQLTESTKPCNVKWPRLEVIKSFPSPSYFSGLGELCRGSFRFLLYQCPCLKIYRNLWYH